MSNQSSRVIISHDPHNVAQSKVASSNHIFFKEMGVASLAWSQGDEHAESEVNLNVDQVKLLERYSNAIGEHYVH